MPSLNTLKTHYRWISIGEIQFPEGESVEETGNHIYIQTRSHHTHPCRFKHSHLHRHVTTYTPTDIRLNQAE